MPLMLEKKIRYNDYYFKKRRGILKGHVGELIYGNQNRHEKMIFMVVYFINILHVKVFL